MNSFTSAFNKLEFLRQFLILDFNFRLVSKGTPARFFRYILYSFSNDVFSDNLFSSHIDLYVIVLCNAVANGSCDFPVCDHRLTCLTSFDFVFCLMKILTSLSFVCQAAEK